MNIKIYIVIFLLIFPLAVFTPINSSDEGEDIEPYIYNKIIVPKDSFGVDDNTEYKEVNWTYFKELFLAHNQWQLECKRYSYSDWTVGNQYLTINRTWNDTGFWKFNLILDVPVSVYSARFTYACDLPVLDYVERAGQYAYYINYTVPGTTETYNCFFDWSDMASIPNVEFTHGIFEGKFWFRFKRDNIPAGHYEFDPTFGYSGVTTGVEMLSYDSGGTWYEQTYGWYFTCPEDCVADSMNVFLTNLGGTYSYQCAIYEYIDHASDYAGALVDATEIKQVSAGAGTYNTTFAFSSPPSLFATTQYYLCVRMCSETSAKCYVQKHSDNVGFKKASSSPVSYPDPLTGEGGDWSKGLIYCSYSPPPSQTPYCSGENPSNNSVGNPISLNTWSVNLQDDQGDSMNGTIECSNGNQTSFTDKYNEAVSLNISSLSFSTTYTVWVNITDGVNQGNYTFYFSTCSKNSVPYWNVINSWGVTILSLSKYGNLTLSGSIIPDSISASLTGGVQGVNVETLTANKYLDASVDYTYQIITPDTNRYIYLNRENATAGNKFYIQNKGTESSDYYLSVYDDEINMLTKLYSQAWGSYVFNGTKWVSAEIPSDQSENNVALGGSSRAFNRGTAVGTASSASTYGVAIGCTAQGNNKGVGIGYSAQGTDFGVAIGPESNTNSNYYSVALGYRSECTRVGELAISPGVDSDQENNIMIQMWDKQTSDSTPVEMLCPDGASRFTIRPSSILMFEIMVTARDDTANDVAGYSFNGLIKRDGSDNTVLVNLTKTVVYEDDVAWDCNVTADDANEALIVTVTSDAVNTVQWVARLDGVETHF